MFKIFTNVQKSTLLAFNLGSIVGLFFVNMLYGIIVCHKENCGGISIIPLYLAMISVYVAVFFLVLSIIGIVRKKPIFPVLNSMFLWLTLCIILIEIVFIALFAN